MPHLAAPHLVACSFPRRPGALSACAFSPPSLPPPLLSLRSEFPIWVCATEGLRELPTAQREAVLASLRGYFATRCPFGTGARLAGASGVRLISGEEEAAFAWIAASDTRAVFVTRPSGVRRGPVVTLGNR